MDEQLMHALTWGLGGALTVLFTVVGFFIKRLIERVDVIIDAGLPAKILNLDLSIESLRRQVQALLEFKEDMAYVRGRMNGSLDRNGEKKNGT